MDSRPTPYRCRHATKDDFPRIAEFVRRFHSQTDYQKIPCGDPTVMLDMMRSQRLLFVATHGDDVIGVIGAVTSPWVLNPSYWAGAVIVVWVEPEHRGHGASEMLMDAAEREARRQGVRVWSIAALEAVKPRATGKFYNRRGYRIAEHVFVKDL